MVKETIEGHEAGNAQLIYTTMAGNRAAGMFPSVELAKMIHARRTIVDAVRCLENVKRMAS